ncbi:MAG: ribulose-phosphate 3-epimerase [Candidatus Micrarchaeota archaeon]
MASISNDHSVKVSASLMCADWLNLGNEIKSLEAAGADSFHVDIMDGSFVQNFALNFWQIDSIRKATKLPLHVHLMAYEPARYLHRLSESGVNTIVFHAEGCKNPDYALREIKDHGINAGVALNVETPMTILFDCLDLVDEILFMATRPGDMGQKFRPDVLPKMSKFVKTLKEQGFHPDISVDGHVGGETIPLLAAEGANIFIGGTTGLFTKDATSSNYKDKIKSMRDLAEKNYKW